MINIEFRQIKKNTSMSVFKLSNIHKFCVFIFKTKCFPRKKYNNISRFFEEYQFNSSIDIREKELVQLQLPEKTIIV